MESRANRRVVRFAAFEFDPQTRELPKRGKQRGQPADALAMLIGAAAAR